MQDLAVTVGEDLELDVARLLDVFLDVYRSIAEGLLRFVSGYVEFLGKRDVIMRDSHPATTAASHCFNNDRIANFTGDFDRLGFVFDRAIRTWHGCYTCLTHSVLGDSLIAHHSDALGFRSDKFDITRFALFREFGVLGKKSVAWMDGIDVGDLSSADDPIRPQVAISTLGAPNADSFIGQLYVQRLHVGL